MSSISIEGRAIILVPLSGVREAGEADELVDKACMRGMGERTTIAGFREEIPISVARGGALYMGPDILRGKREPKSVKPHPHASRGERRQR